MYELFAESSFSAAHRLDHYPGNCARWHGHNWTVRVRMTADALNSVGLGVDLRDIKVALRALVEKFDHAVLNDVPELGGHNPTCELLAEYVYQTLAEQLNTEHAKLSKVEVYETPTSGAAYFE